MFAISAQDCRSGRSGRAGYRRFTQFLSKQPELLLQEHGILRI
jgi:hypothetical protein